jgi:hypothetical protein
MEAWRGAAAYRPLLLVVIGAALVVSFPHARTWPLLSAVAGRRRCSGLVDWEFSNKGAPYALFVAVLGYVGFGLGMRLRRLARRRHDE